VCPLAGLEEFKTLLGKFDTLCQMMNASGNVETVTENQAQPIRTESLRCENKLFFFDLRANNRGRFLKISQVSIFGTSSTPRGGGIYFVDVNLLTGACSACRVRAYTLASTALGLQV
jgi:hypothetical protein